MRKIRVKSITEDGEKSLTSLINQKRGKAKRAERFGDIFSFRKLLRDAEQLENLLERRKNIES